MMHIVTMATTIQFIDGKCYIKKWKSRKLLYPVIMDVFHMTFINALGGGHTRKHTDVQTKTISRNQAHVAKKHAVRKTKLIRSL